MHHYLVFKKLNVYPILPPKGAAEWQATSDKTISRKHLKNNSSTDAGWERALLKRLGGRGRSSVGTRDNRDGTCLMLKRRVFQRVDATTLKTQFLHCVEQAFW